MADKDDDKKEPPESGWQKAMRHTRFLMGKYNPPPPEESIPADGTDVKPDKIIDTTVKPPSRG